MIHEVLIFTCPYSKRKVGRYGVEWNPAVFESYMFTILYLLKTSDEHEWGCRNPDIFEYNNCQYGRTQKGNQNPFYDIAYFV